MKLNIEFYLKVDFLGTGVGLEEAYNQNRKRNTYGCSRLLVVLDLDYRASVTQRANRNIGLCYFPSKWSLNVTEGQQHDSIDQDDSPVAM